jgi:eukaryotic-like serine/threonine-protein kinase
MAASPYHKTRQLYAFGPFRVDADKELLLRDNQAVPLAPKAFQVLLVLIRRQKELVTKDELLKTVWPDTFVEEANLSRNVFLLRKALGESPQDHQYVVTVPGRGYRFAEDVQFVPGAEVSIVAASHSRVEIQIKETSPWLWISALAILILAIAAATIKLSPRHTHALSEKDTVVLADFANSTGDSAFDGALRQGLAVQLEQSPFLSLISEDRIGQTLTLMGRPRDVRLTPEVAREVCQRAGSTAMIDGSIARLGNQYVLGLKAIDCRSGDALAEEQATVDSKERVLKALSRSAAELRSKLGETLSTVQKFDTPLEQATTPSLEALQAYSFGRKAMAANAWVSSIPFLERAIRLDPNFAMAYARLGTSYKNLGESSLGIENLGKAYDLREHTSEREKFYVESHYYQDAQGNLEKARQIYELWAQIYPRDWTPHIDLWDLYNDLGQLDRALEAVRESVRLNRNALGYCNLTFAYLVLNRLPEAQAVAEEAQAKQLDSPGLHFNLYRLAFVQNDRAGMARQVAWAAGKPGVEDVLLAREAERIAGLGQLEKAREVSRHAVASAEQAKETEVAAVDDDIAALWESFSGNTGQARQRASEALRLSTGRNAQFGAALALALAGDAGKAQTLADDLAKRFPDDTIVRFYYLPTMRAQVELSRSHPAKALEALQVATPYELGSATGLAGGMYPVYLRGVAYLAMHRGVEAAVEFEKILEYRALVAGKPTGVMASLGLARAYAIQGDRVKAKAQYQELLAHWKDADPHFPLLKQAKAEYARLQ